MQGAVESVQKKISEGFPVLGECDHPPELTVNVDRVSHMIENMWMDGPNGYGKLKIVPTPMGNIIRTLIESGATLGVSSRGSGEVDNSGNVKNFEIVTVDIDPNEHKKGLIKVDLEIHSDLKTFFNNFN